MVTLKFNQNVTIFNGNSLFYHSFAFVFWFCYRLKLFNLSVEVQYLTFAPHLTRIAFLHNVNLCGQDQFHACGADEFDTNAVRKQIRNDKHKTRLNFLFNFIAETKCESRIFPSLSKVSFHSVCGGIAQVCLLPLFPALLIRNTHK